MEREREWSLGNRPPLIIKILYATNSQQKIALVLYNHTSHDGIEFFIATHPHDVDSPNNIWHLNHILKSVTYQTKKYLYLYYNKGNIGLTFEKEILKTHIDV